MLPSAAETHRWRRWTLITLTVVLCAWLLLVALVRPSNDRDWNLDQARVATAEINGDQVRVRNVRHAHYRTTEDFDVQWQDRTYDLARLESVWFIVEPFADWRGPAHTFLSFGFAGGDYVAISVEIRKQRGESFSPLRGLLRQYELAYVIGDERDLIGLRANHRKDEVFLYPIRATRARIRALFVAMLERANAIAAEPEFYNTLGNNCTSNIVEHINLLAPERIPFSYKTYLPAYADDLAFDLGLIDTELPRDQFRMPHRINDLAAQHANTTKFSAAIRSRFP